MPTRVDHGFLPSNFAGASDVAFFNSPNTITSGATDFFIWKKPRGITMLGMICVGAGGGGGGGFTAAAAAARGGGGSGACSGFSKLIIPAWAVPDVLYVKIAKGGLGVGSGGGTAGSGANSFILIRPNTLSALNTLLVSNTNAPAGGGTGTGAAVGALGGAPTIATQQNSVLSGVGQWSAFVGVQGVAGGAVAGAIGPPIAIPLTGVFTMPGAGGAGTTAADFAGGIITAVANDSHISDVRPVGAAAGSFNGSSGHLLRAPLWSYGGLGGSSSNAGVGGNGGNGGPGSGGGGGGGGTTGGKGGDGGDGMVIIWCW